MNAFSHNLDEVSYPRMERQDLTQGQLGSFKFTPTDEIRSMYGQRTSHLLQQQLAESLSTCDRLQAASSAVSAEVTPPIHTSPTLLSSRLSPTVLSDPAFFEKYIKGDLADARLRLGPAAFRAAVDNASTSPKKGSRHTGATEHSMMGQDFMQPYATSFIPRHLRDSSDMNSSFSSVPASASETRREETSLIRALASEQESHELTKTALRSERAARVQSECETRRLSDLNRSLRGTVNLLKSIISHNEKKQQEAEAGAPCQTIQDPDVVRLHDDVISSRRLSGEHKESEQETNQNSFDHFQNIDLLLVDRRPVVNTAGSKDITQLIDLSGPVQEPSKSSQCVDRISFQPDSKASKMASSRDESVKLEVDDTQKTTLPANLAKDQTSKKVVKGYDKDGSIDVVASELESSADTSFERLSLNESKDDHATTPRGDVKEDASTMMAMPNTPNIKWQVTATSPVFDNDYQKFHHLGSAKNFPNAFYEHPVRYMPDKAEKNLYRTVMIDFIPQGTSYKDILKDIRGGALESIQLVKPIGKANDFMTARVVFNYELDAQTLYLHGQNPGMFLDGKRLRVWQVLQPKYPKNAQLEKDIFEDGFTRFLIIQGASENALAKLPQKLATQIRQGFILTIGNADDGLPMVEFTSVAECGKAMRQLVADREFGGAAFDFEEDPCMQPY